MVIAGLCAEPSFRTHSPFLTNRASSLGCGSATSGAVVAVVAGAVVAANPPLALSLRCSNSQAVVPSPPRISRVSTTTTAMIEAFRRGGGGGAFHCGGGLLNAFGWYVDE